MNDKIIHALLPFREQSVEITCLDFLHVKISGEQRTWASLLFRVLYIGEFDDGLHLQEGRWLSVLLWRCPCCRSHSTHPVCHRLLGRQSPIKEHWTPPYQLNCRTGTRTVQSVAQALRQVTKWRVWWRRDSIVHLTSHPTVHFNHALHHDWYNYCEHYSHDEWHRQWSRDSGLRD